MAKKPLISKPLGIDDDEVWNRESWLNNAIDILEPVFARRGFPLPQNIRAAVGWPKNKKHLGECYASDASTGGIIEIFISPLLSEPIEILDVLMHQLCHAAVGCEHGHKKPFVKCAEAMNLAGRAPQARGLDNPEWGAWARPLCEKLGPIPHDAMVTKAPAEKTQTTRNVKKECKACGCTIRLTKKWIDKALANGGWLRCPDAACAGALA